MFVTLCCDVGIKRNPKIKNPVRKYLRPVQNSVCEGYITDSKLHRLCIQLKCLIDPNVDSPVIYKPDSEGSMEKASIGQACENEDFIL